MADANGAVIIDLGAVTPRNSALIVAKSTARLILGYFLGFALYLLWFVLLAFIGDAIIGDGETPGEIIAIGVVLILLAAPAVIFFYWIISRQERYQAGIDTAVSATSFDEKQLATTIPVIDVSLSDLLDRLRSFAASLGAPARYRETDAEKVKKARKLRWQALGFFGAAGVWILLIAPRFGETMGGLVVAVIFGAALGSAQLALMRARKLLQPSATALLAQDKRRKILLLRSFKDDEIICYKRFKTPIGEVVMARRFEQGIAGPLGAYGPVIAIGKPGEEMPQIGAARTYLSEADWQPTVLRWMGEALALVMIVGDTEWIRWELDRILELRRDRHLLLLLPPAKGDERWRNVLKVLGATIWGPTLSALDTKGVLLVQLRPDGKVIAIRKEGRPLIEDYHLAIAVALYKEFIAPSEPQPAATA